MILDINILQYFLYDCIFFKELLLYLFLLINIGLLNLLFNYNDFIILLISIEMILFSIGLLFIIFSNNFGSFEGYIYSAVIVTIASTESIMGLSLLIRLHRLRGSIKSILKFNLYG